MSKDRCVPTASIQTKYDQLANLSVLCPRQHALPSLTQELDRLMYWG